MPEENDSETTVSRNRYDAVVKERDDHKAQVADATKALASYQRRDAARTALKNKVEDPDAVADLIAPHLNDVKVEDVATHIASEQFAPRLAAFKAAAATVDPATPPPEGEPATGAEPATETPGFGGGPSPGQNTGAQPLPGESKIVRGSPEWDQLIASDNREALEAAYKADRIVEPARGF